MIQLIFFRLKEDNFLQSMDFDNKSSESWSYSKSYCRVKKQNFFNLSQMVRTVSVSKKKKKISISNTLRGFRVFL